MSWLYEHCDGLDELKHFAGIAYRATYGTRSPDRDDLEQDIVIAMIGVLAKRGYVEEAYLWGIARTQIKIYWSKKAEELKRYVPLYEDSDDDDNDGQEMSPTRDDLEVESRLDAIAILSTLPKRLIEIGYKRLNGEKLSMADREYWDRTKKKVAYTGSGCHLSENDKRRIERLYGKGWSIYQIAKTMGRNKTTVRLYLYERGIRDIEEVPAPFLKELERETVEV